jgi:hypothetical protein
MVYLGKINKSVSVEHIYICFDRQIFCDFGEEFKVLDTTGENPLTQIVTEISRVSIYQCGEILELDVVF